MGKAQTKLAPKQTVAPKRMAAPLRAKSSAKPTHMAKPTQRPPQKFTVSHETETSFETGLRRYAQYRDLGIAAATHGLAQAHVIRFVPPCRPEEVSKLHFHDVEFQMVYVLKGWLKSEFEGEGAITMRQGSCWIQPPRVKHKVLDYSDDCEVLEIILPAQFDTVELEK